MVKLVTANELQDDEKLAHCLYDNTTIGQTFKTKDPEWHTPKHVNTYLVACLGRYEMYGRIDKELWESFQEDFEDWTEDLFALAEKKIRTPLRDFLRDNGVCVGGTKYISKQLYNVVQEDEYQEWPAEEVTKQMRTGRDFNSYQNPTFPAKLEESRNTPGPRTTTTPGPAERQTPGPAERQTPGPAERQTPGPAERQTPGPAEMQTHGPAKMQTPGSVTMRIPHDATTFGQTPPFAPAQDYNGKERMNTPGINDPKDSDNDDNDHRKPIMPIRAPSTEQAPVLDTTSSKALTELHKTYGNDTEIKYGGTSYDIPATAAAPSLVETVLTTAVPVTQTYGMPACKMVRAGWFLRVDPPRHRPPRDRDRRRPFARRDGPHHRRARRHHPDVRLRQRHADLHCGSR